MGREETAALRCHLVFLCSPEAVFLVLCVVLISTPAPRLWTTLFHDSSIFWQLYLMTALSLGNPISRQLYILATLSLDNSISSQLYLWTTPSLDNSFS